jgi:hypothetical protein
MHTTLWQKMTSDGIGRCMCVSLGGEWQASLTGHPNIENLRSQLTEMATRSPPPRPARSLACLGTSESGVAEGAIRSPARRWRGRSGETRRAPTAPRWPPPSMVITRELLRVEAPEVRDTQLELLPVTAREEQGHVPLDDEPVVAILDPPMTMNDALGYPLANHLAPGAPRP